MYEVFSLTLPFFGLILVGYLSGKWKPLPPEAMGWLSRFIIYAALPALFFKLISQTPAQELANWGFILMTTGSTLLVFLMSVIVGYLLSGRALKAATIQGFVGAYGNVGYMGPGLTLSAFGPAAATPTGLIICFDNVLHFTMAPLFMAIADGNKAKIGATARVALVRVLTHPFILATIAGAIFSIGGFYTPDPLDKFLGYLSNAAAPTALFALGLTVAQRPVKRVAVELPVLLILKLMIHPALVYMVLTILGDFDPIWVATAVLMAALPPAANVFVLAQQYDVYVERASSSILIGTMASVVTVTGILFLLT